MTEPTDRVAKLEEAVGRLARIVSALSRAESVGLQKPSAMDYWRQAIIDSGLIASEFTGDDQ